VLAVPRFVELVLGVEFFLADVRQDGDTPGNGECGAGHPCGNRRQVSVLLVESHEAKADTIQAQSNAGSLNLIGVKLLAEHLYDRAHRWHQWDVHESILRRWFRDLTEQQRGRRRSSGFFVLEERSIREQVETITYQRHGLIAKLSHGHRYLMVPLTTTEQVAEFIQEARNTAKLKHPLLVTIYDVQEESGLPFIVQEYIEGENLAEWTAKHQPTFVQIVRILMGITDALSTSQEHFASKAVEELVEEDNVISVRLSLFADMLKTRPWTLKSLSDMGGASGVGVTFLEETFSGKAAPPAAAAPDSAACLLHTVRGSQYCEATGYQTRLHLLQHGNRRRPRERACNFAYEIQSDPQAGVRGVP